MVRIKTLAAVATMSAMTAACSGGGSESSAPAEPTTQAAPEPAAAPAPAPAAVPAGPPALDDVTTKDGVDYASLTGDAAKGKTVFAQCRTCHVTDPGVNKTGPSLAGLIGRKSGTVPGFAYSDANKNSGITWTEAKLFQYLENPQRVIPKTKMIFTGLPDAQKRADVIAYLKNPT
jgi:cytochrome c